ncbi:hypothetical protein N7478_007448 [Penicillium angulare]|uniref:uncharacterized protein n=1 Tax=Penicillium angulare TaxID=116970 RepID=UPI0025420979|nr:uncharacterized protein N7478_007448 [Penicillium angulare]KAJ5272323.1 hypothetical protein N7478_007448 [Penicillium angulare]
MPAKIAFISGPIDTGPQEIYFHEHYIPKLKEAVERGDNFVIGPIPSGVDADALSYLLAFPIAPTRITICVTPAENGMWGVRLRSTGVHVQVVDGQMSRERDATLTSISTYDILRIRTKEEAGAFYGRMSREAYVTNTERNWKRRRGIEEYAKVDAEEINNSVGMK